MLENYNNWMAANNCGDIHGTLIQKIMFIDNTAVLLFVIVGAIVLSVALSRKIKKARR